MKLDKLEMVSLDMMLFKNGENENCLRIGINSKSDGNHIYNCIYKPLRSYKKISEKTSLSLMFESLSGVVFIEYWHCFSMISET